MQSISSFISSESSSSLTVGFSFCSSSPNRYPTDTLKYPAIFFAVSVETPFFLPLLMSDNVLLLRPKSKHILLPDTPLLLQRDCIRSYKVHIYVPPILCMITKVREYARMYLTGSYVRSILSTDGTDLRTMLCLLALSL